MITQLFVNLPVKDLKRSVEFFTKLGFSFDPRFTDENATCLIVNKNTFVMLLVEPFFNSFTAKTLCDTTRAAEAIMAVSAESRNEVDEVAAKAVAAGARLPKGPTDYGFMYQQDFEDPDGHLWEVFWMDEAEFEKSQAKK